LIEEESIFSFGGEMALLFLLLLLGVRDFFVAGFFHLFSYCSSVGNSFQNKK
jgi:hypothetical protein